MPSGIIKRWHADKGFGFIKPDGGAEDMFCHVSSLLDGDGGVSEGDTVKFKVEWDERRGKDRAIQVKRTGGPGGGAAVASDRATKPAPAGATKPTPNDAVKLLAKLSPDFKAAWVAYCKEHGEGFSDPAKYEEPFFVEFFTYAGGLMKQDLKVPAKVVPQKAEKRAVAPADSEDEDEPAPPPKAQKRAKAAEEDAGDEAATQAAPVEKKKLTIKKAVADEIRRINAAGGLLTQVRVGAVAAALGQLEEAAALEILSALEFQQEDIDDPNEFIKLKAKESL